MRNWFKKLKTLIHKDIHLRNVLLLNIAFWLLWLVYATFEVIYLQDLGRFLESQIDQNTHLMFIFWVPTAICTVWLTRRYVIQTNLRIKSTLFALFVVSGVFYFVISLIIFQLLQFNLPYLSLGEQLETIVQIVIIAFLFNILPYVYTSRTGNFLLPWILMALLISAIEIYSNLGSSWGFRGPNWTDAVKLLLLFAILFALMRIAQRAKLRPAQKPRLPKLAFVLVLLAIIASSWLALHHVFTTLERKVDLIQEIQREQSIFDDDDDDDGFDGDELDGDELIEFSERSGEIRIATVGFYQSQRPRYLKLSTFGLEMSAGKFEINELEDKDCLNYGEIFYDRPSADSIRLVYKYQARQSIPTAGIVTDYEVSRDCLSQYELLRRINYYDETDVYTTQYDFVEPRAYTDIYDDFRGEYSYRETQLARKYNDIDTSTQGYAAIRNLTLDITSKAGAETDLEKAQAVENYFKENYYYSLSPNIAGSVNPVTAFILAGTHGYCTHFATSMVTMLETVGVKSRVVGGFYSDNYSAQMQSYLILSSDLHLWVEVLSSDDNETESWVRFEPTSNRCDAERDNCGQLYGGGAGRQDGGAARADYRYVLEAIDPQVSFEELFSGMSNEGLTGTAGFEPRGEGQAEREREIEEAEREMETDSIWEELEEILARIDEEISRLANQNPVTQRLWEIIQNNRVILLLITIIMLTLVAAIIGGRGVRGVYKVITAKLHRRARMRQLGLKVRRKVLERLSIKPSAKMLQKSNLQFSESLETELATDAKFRAELKRFFELSDSILYAPYSTKEEYQEALRIASKLLNREGS